MLGVKERITTYQIDLTRDTCRFTLEVASVRGTPGYDADFFDFCEGAPRWCREIA